MDTMIMIINYFMIYSVLGWVVEVVYHAVGHGVIVNRGFLNGPVCPIYGFGMLLVLGLLGPVSDNLVYLFFGGMFLTTAIELLGGWALEKLFHMRWWDYSKEPFNFRGYICPRFSLAWGLGVVIVVRVIHTTIAGISDIVLESVLKYALIPVGVLFIIDLAATVSSIMKLQTELKHLDHLAQEMRGFSDSLTDVIGGRALEFEQKIDESKVQVALGKAEGLDYVNRRRSDLEKEIQERRKQIEQIASKLYTNKLFGAGRILSAYPHMILVQKGQELKESVEQFTKRL